MNRSISLGLVSIVFAAAMHAQAPGTYDAEGNYYWPNGMGRSPLKRKGIWKIQPIHAPGGNYEKQAAASAAEVQAMTATLDRLTAVFKATPEFERLEGYWMRESRIFVYVPKQPFEFGTRFFPFALEDILKNGRYEPLWGGETSSIYFAFNRLPGSLQRQVIAEERTAGGLPVPFYLRPRATDTYRGYPVYEGQDLVIARSGRDPWAPVSYARAMQAVMKHFESDRDAAERRLADLRKKNEEAQSPAYEQQMRAHLEKYSGEFRTSNPAKWQGRVAGMERELKYNREKAAKEANPQRDKDGAWYWNPLDAHAEAVKRLAAIAPPDANTPACYLEAPKEKTDGRYAIKGSIEKAGSGAACTEMVTDNPAYFDAKAPRTEPQILVVSSLNRCGTVKDGQLIRNWIIQPGKVAHGCAFHPFYWEQMDWAKVAAMVTR
jgi:hypothetical protein